MQMTSKWKALADLGQSVWYDNVAVPRWNRACSRS